MLFLRRKAGDSITFIQNRRVLGKITVIRVDVDADEVDVEIDLGAGPKHRTLLPGAEVRLLEGVLVFKFSFILQYDRYPPAASLGIEAPRSIGIYRSERLVGLGPDQIAALHKE